MHENTTRNANANYFSVRDNCREGLLKYLAKALALIHRIEDPQILDAGCGTGVPTMYIAKELRGRITAIDTDNAAINFLRKKVNKLGLTERITLFNGSIFDVKLNEDPFDIIISEGLLNVIGFQNGFLRIKELLKKKGSAIIHDEFKDHKRKIAFIGKNGCEVLDSFILDEHIWWDEYYKCLENTIATISEESFLKFFKTDILEIESFKKDPSQFKSIYYVIRKK